MILKIIFITILVLIILISFMLLLPIHYEIVFKKDGEIEAKGDIYYPFKIIDFHFNYFLLLNLNLKIFGIKIIDKTIDLSYKKTDNKNIDNHSKKDKNSIIKKFLSLKMKQKLSVISNLKKDLPIALKRIKPKYDNIILDLGHDNPFLLGLMLSVLSPLKLILKNLKIYPNFNKKIVKIDMSLMSDINLWTLLVILLKFRFSKKYRLFFD